MSFKPSQYQQAIYDEIERGTRSIIVEAVAGSGKTTTIVEAANLIPQGNSTLFLAFNKSITNELRSVLPESVRSATFHSICFGTYARSVPTNKVIEVIESKVPDIITKKFTGEDAEMYGSFVKKAVGHAKSAGLGFLQGVTWQTVIDHFDLSLDSEEADLDRAIDLADKTLSLSDRQRLIVDFDDMLRLPLIYSVPFWKNDFVFVDEAQDLNPVQQALLERMVKPGGRVIAVGDSKQAIYGFRGADSDSMNLLAKRFNCKPLPLSICYRCSKAVVEAAKSIVPQIEAFEGAPEGFVGPWTPGEDNRKGFPDFEPTDAILCRNVAPLVSYAYRLLSDGTPCRIMGREIGSGLVKLIQKMKGRTIEDLQERLIAWQDRETQKALSKGQDSKVDAIEDQVSCLFVFIDMLDENRRTIMALIQKIEKLFGDSDEEKLTLSTAHKSKGLEWETVYLLDAEKYMPSKWARKEWALEQEENLKYVAYTRAKKDLFFLDSGDE